MKVVKKEELRKLMLGELRGNIGNLNAQVRNGKIILRRRPLKFNKSNSAAAVRGRNRFAVACNIANKIVTLPVLCKCWKRNLKRGMSVQNYATKLNYEKTQGDRPGINNIITPPGGFPLRVMLVEIFENIIDVSFEPIDKSVLLTGNEKGYILNGLLCYHNPADPKDKLYTITTLEHSFNVRDVSEPVNLEIALKEEQKKIAARYKSAIVYLAMVVVDSEGCITGYSSTYAKEI